MKNHGRHLGRHLSVLLWLSALVIPYTLHAQTNVVIDPAVLTVSKGDTVRMIVEIREVVDLRGVSVHIAFNKSILHFISAEVGDFLAGNPDAFDVFFFVTKRPLVSPDSVLIDQAIGGMSAVSGTGRLFNLCFFAEQGGETTISLKNLDLRSLDNQRIPSIGSGCLVTVRSGNNRAPSKPVLLAPLDGMTLQSNDDTLRWSSSVDPDGDPLKYSLHISGKSVDTIFTDLTNTFFQLSELSLAPQTIYYWYVQARDYASISRSEQTFSFITPISTNIVNTEPARDFAILSISPNPASTAIWVQYLMQIPGSIRISIIDLSGREVVAIPGTRQPRGIHTHRLPLTTLSPGVYQCVLSTPVSLVTRKIVVVK